MAADFTKPQFCYACGGKLKCQFVEDEDCTRLVCQDCGAITYINPRVVAAAIPEFDGKIMLLRRAIEPSYGMWTFPAGYVDLWESVPDGAAREVMEEINVPIDINSLLGVYSSSDSPIALVVYRATALTSNIYPGRETMEARLFAPDEIPWDDLAFPTTKAALRDWVEQVGLVLVA